MISPEQMLEDIRQLLNVVPHEARQRTIISRAYYTAYHFLLNHPCCSTYVRSPGRGTHVDLLDFLSRSHEPNVLHAADILNSLYARRIEADYQLNYHIMDGTEKRCVEDATYIIKESLVEYDTAKDRRAT